MSVDSFFEFINLNNFKNYKILNNQGQLSILVLFSFVIISILLVAIQPEPEANVNKPVPVIVDVVKLKIQNISWDMMTYLPFSPIYRVMDTKLTPNLLRCYLKATLLGALLKIASREIKR